MEGDTNAPLRSASASRSVREHCIAACSTSADSWTKNLAVASIDTNCGSTSMRAVQARPVQAKIGSASSPTMLFTPSPSFLSESWMTKPSGSSWPRVSEESRRSIDTFVFHDELTENDDLPATEKKIPAEWKTDDTLLVQKTPAKSQ